MNKNPILNKIGSHGNIMIAQQKVLGVHPQYPALFYIGGTTFENCHRVQSLCMRPKIKKSIKIPQEKNIWG